METKNCPYCGEEILSAAAKCKHCGEWLEAEAKYKAEQGVKKCPHCGEEILGTAAKCKHCNEWLVKVDEDTEDEEPSSIFFNRILIPLIYAGIGGALFYFGSWKLVIGKKISLADQFISSLFSGKNLSLEDLKLKDLIWEDSGILLRIDEKYYGFAQDARFFDSPIIQWAMLGVSIFAFFYALEVLILGRD